MKYKSSRYLEELYRITRELNNDVMITLAMRFNISTKDLVKSELIRKYLEKKRW